MSRLTRRIAACVAATALAFAQLAVSAYACPQQERAAPAKAAAAPAGVTEHCAKQGKQNLCERHCAYGESSLQASPPALSAPDLAPLPWRIELISAPAASPHACKSLVAPRAEPPPHDRFGVLRI